MSLICLIIVEVSLTVLFCYAGSVS